MSNPKFYLDKLPRCEYEVEVSDYATYSRVDSCGEPATHLASWHYGYPSHEPEEMYLCEEHAELVETAESEEVVQAKETSPTDAIETTQG